MLRSLSIVSFIHNRKDENEILNSRTIFLHLNRVSKSSIYNTYYQQFIYLHILIEYQAVALFLIHTLHDSQRNFGLQGGSMAPSEKYATHKHFMFSLYFPHSASSKSWVRISQLSITSPQPSPVQVSSDTSNMSWSNSWLPSPKFCPWDRRMFLSFRLTA